MQALLSLEQAPPLSAPLRFFLTAPLFAILAGGLMLWSGPALFESRWSAQALAVTHLMTVGFMLQAMLGALQQLLPVVAGANIKRPLWIATVVHITITLGAVCLVAAFLTSQPLLFTTAAVLLCLGLFVFIVAAARALKGVPDTSPVIRGLRLALLGLGVTVSLGLLLALSLGGSFKVPLVSLTNIHLGWGFVGWGCALLGAFGLTVVPMFQQTPAYPEWFSRYYSRSTVAITLLWSVAELVAWELVASILSVGVVLMSAVFALSTLHLQRQSKRAKPDATGRLWQIAMLSTLLAGALWLVARVWPMVTQWQGWPLLFGVLVLFGGFMSVIIGMLYKIVPFLVWLHLHHQGRGRLIAPNMKKVLPQNRIDRQAMAHLLSVGLLVLAVFWPQWLAYPAGMGLVLANGWLLHNLLLAMRVYRDHLAKLNAIPVSEAVARH
ncbi:MAG: permease [Rhodoferax sp.]|jgi:hypothetical protein|nr:hypothetical protein [Rhodoferax sp.]MBP9060094.1 permease [Rhodoferax sp.]MBP9683864.1 permease [Rhodoferax sp.]